MFHWLAYYHVTTLYGSLGIARSALSSLMVP